MLNTTKGNIRIQQRLFGGRNRVYTRLKRRKTAKGLNHLIYHLVYFPAPKGALVEPNREINGVKRLTSAKRAVHENDILNLRYLEKAKIHEESQGGDNQNHKPNHKKE